MINQLKNNLRSKAFDYIKKNNPAKRANIIIKNRIPPRQYLWRGVMPEFGSVFTSSPTIAEFPTIMFQPRKWIGGMGWDFDRQQFHCYASRKQKTTHTMPWQWSWKSWGMTLPRCRRHVR